MNGTLVYYCISEPLKKPDLCRCRSTEESPDCGSVYGEDRVKTSMLCAGWPEGGRDSCQVGGQLFLEIFVSDDYKQYL